MFSLGRMWLAAPILMVMTCLPAGSALAAQRSDRRVLTNEDVVQPAPAAAPAPAENSPAPDATPQVAPSPAQSEAMPQAAPVPSPAQDPVRQLAAIVDAIGQASDILADKLQQGAGDDAARERWTQQRATLTDVLSEFRQFVAEAQAEAQAQQRAQAQKAAAAAAAEGQGSASPQ